MMENMKKKIRKLWRDHKGLIIGGGVLLGVILLAATKETPRGDAEEPEATPAPSLPDYSGYTPEQTEEKKDDYNTDHPLPCGGEYRCNDLEHNQKEDEQHMDGFGTVVINGVPLANMGQLGQDVIELCRQAGLEEKGWNNMENGVACMILGIQSMEVEAKQEETADPQEPATDEAEASAEETTEEEAA